MLTSFEMSYLFVNFEEIEVTVFVICPCFVKRKQKVSKIFMSFFVGSK